MDRFRKRIYGSLREFMGDVLYIIRNRNRLNRILKTGSLSPAFRERLMLAVTQVNDCRFCARFHSKAALEEGIPRGEVDAILDGNYEDCPSEELAGILYATHWAETCGTPDSAVREKLIAAYGGEMSGDIDLILRLIRTGNLTGNTFDYFLYRVSAGRWGLPEKTGGVSQQ